MNGQFPHDSVQPQVSEVFTCLPGFTGFDQELPHHIYVAWHHKKGLFPVSSLVLTYQFLIPLSQIATRDGII